MYPLPLFRSLPACSTGLRDLEVILPPAAVLGESISLSCHYHLQGEELYTLKLYKGRNEFLQLVPGKRDSVKTFALKGLDVRVSSSNRLKL